jgi:hypothetical protein
MNLIPKCVGRGTQSPKTAIPPDRMHKKKGGECIKGYNVPPYPIHYYFPLRHPSTFFGPLINKRVQVSFYVVDFKLIEACTQSDNARDYTIEKVASRLSSFDNRSDHHH